MTEALARALVGQPLHILVVALLNFGLWAGVGMTAMRGAPKGNVLWVPALLWLAYAGWEWRVVAVTPGANIRFDLLLIWPLIAIVTLWAIVRTVFAWRFTRPRVTTRT